MSTRPSPPSDQTAAQRGFAMLAVVVVLIGVGALIALSALRGVVESHRSQQTRTMDAMTVIADALVAYAAVNNRLPCPADPDAGASRGLADPTTASACNTADGIVPWRTLGLLEEQAVDQWGGAFLYRVAEALSNPPGGTLTVAFPNESTSDGLTVCRVPEAPCSATGQVTGPDAEGDRPGGAFALISRGPTDEAGTGAWEVINQGDGDVFYDLPFTVRDADGERLPTDDSDHFDDIVATMSVQTLMRRAGLLPKPSIPTLLTPGSFTTTENTAQHLKPEFKTAPRPEWAVTDQVFFFGGGSSAADTYDLTPGNVQKTSCAWHDTRFDLTTQTLRGFARFQMLPGEASSFTTLGTGQGFAIMLIPGTRTVSSNSCGQAQADNAFGFKGVARPKMALEFDIYRDEYEGMNDTSSGRNNPRPEGNHVALLNPSTQDYIGHGTTGNPQCQVWGTHGNGPALNGSFGACTYPPGNPADYAGGQIDPRPAYHTVRPANWLEDGQYFDTPTGQDAAQPYVVRFEVTRGCNASCTTCGTAGAPNVRFKAWVACDATAFDDNPNDCPKMPDDFRSLSTSLPESAVTDYMVNYCMPDRSLAYAESFDTVRLGIGFSTRNSAVALILHRLEALSSND